MPRVTIGPFSLEAGGDWTLSTVILAGPKPQAPAVPPMPRAKAAPAFQENLVATMEQVPPGESAEEYLKKQIEGLRKAGVARTKGTEPEKVRLESGLQGVLLEQVIEGQGGEWVRQMELITIKEGVAYTVIASQLDGEPFRQSRETFRRMLLSFR